MMNTVVKAQLKKENKGVKTKEKIKRSLAKTISWRVVGTLDTIIITWLITRTLTIAFSVGAIELVSKMILYFFHERVWNSIKWGK